MLTSREVLRRTGISRATLNNYIALGILPRPIVSVAQPGSGSVRRIGYFDDQVVARIAEVQRLKREGMTMSDISARFARPDAGGATPAGVGERRTLEFVPRPRPEAEPGGEAPAAPRVVVPGRPLRLTVDDLPHPAYMVSNNFELEWWNVAAANEIFHTRQGLEAESEARNVFRLLLAAQGGHDGADWLEALRLHLGVAKNRLAAVDFAGLAPAVGAERAALLTRLYDETPAIATRHVVRARVRLHDQLGQAVDYEAFASFFREGVLFTYLPAGEEADSLLDFLARREQVIRDLLRRQMPVLTHLAVLVADIDGGAALATGLPPEEYFQLVNDVWRAMEPVFRTYYGTHGKHRDDGLVYYFLPQPDCNYVLNAITCACELREAMRRIGRDWRARRNLPGELRLNVGLNEGHEWFGSFHAGATVDFTVLGETVERARALARLARGGAIAASRDMINVLTVEQRERLRYGVRRRDAAGGEIMVPTTFAELRELIDLAQPGNAHLSAFRSLAVAEISDIVPGRPA